MQKGKIANIFYTDAGYGFEEKIPKEMILSKCEAYGYAFSDEKNFFVHFIKRAGEDILPHKFIKGLIIPKPALLLNAKNFKGKIAFKKGQEVSLVWDDIVIVGNNERRDSSLMETSGVVFADFSSHVVLEKPITVRTFPLPEENHPQEGIPFYYVIPKALLKNSRIIFDKTEKTVKTKAEKVEKVEKGEKKKEKEEEFEDVKKIVRVNFTAEDKNEYECVGVFMKEEKDFLEVAFNAVDGEVLDFLEIPQKFISKVEEVDKRAIEVFR